MDRNSQPLRVLIVEDDADNAESLALLLRLWGHGVVVCRSAPEALKAAPAYAPQVVLLDIGLPGMDGWEAARQLRRQGPVLLIGISGFGREEDLLRAHLEGLDHFLVKPAEPEHLERLLREAATRHAAGLRLNTTSR
jgi:CheY-like chemotaxis protein